jgi:hypothetical protein
MAPTFSSQLLLSPPVKTVKTTATPTTIERLEITDFTGK